MIRRILFQGGPLENLFKGCLTLVVFLALVIFVNITISAQDWQWYRGGFEGQPSRIVIYHEGQQTELQAGDTGFGELAEAVQASLAAGVVRQSNIGLSPTSLDDAYNKNMSVEVFFDQPVKLHAPFNTGRPTQMLFLITGRHSDLPLVFLGTKGAYGVGTPALNSIQPIRDALLSQGYLR